MCSSVIFLLDQQCLLMLLIGISQTRGTVAEGFGVRFRVPGVGPDLARPTCGNETLPACVVQTRSSFAAITEYENM
jgi:hypothetical protein